MTEKKQNQPQQNQGSQEEGPTLKEGKGRQAYAESQAQGQNPADLEHCKESMRSCCVVNGTVQWQNLLQLLQMAVQFIMQNPLMGAEEKKSKVDELKESLNESVRQCKELASK